MWKDLGFEARDQDGELVRPDDPRLNDVWETAADLDLPVLIHTADPLAFWDPVDRRNERFEELVRYPEWHHAGGPPHAELVDSLESLVAAHPRTTFIAAHMASLAEDLDRVATLLDRYPNLYVDTSAREAELGRQPRRARDLLTRYADRVLWGTDSFPVRTHQYRAWFRMLETSDEYFPYAGEAIPDQGRWAVYGLDLDEPVLAALYAGNARRIVPGLR